MTNVLAVEVDGKFYRVVEMSESEFRAATGSKDQVKFLADHRIDETTYTRLWHDQAGRCVECARDLSLSSMVQFVEINSPGLACEKCIPWSKTYDREGV